MVGLCEESVRALRQWRSKLLTFLVADELAAAVAATVADAARSGNDNGDGLVWTTPVGHVIHHRTGLPLEKAA